MPGTLGLGNEARTIECLSLWLLRCAEACRLTNFNSEASIGYGSHVFHIRLPCSFCVPNQDLGSDIVSSLPRNRLISTKTDELKILNLLAL